MIFSMRGWILLPYKLHIAKYSVFSCKTSEFPYSSGTISGSLRLLVPLPREQSRDCSLECSPQECSKKTSFHQAPSLLPSTNSRPTCETSQRLLSWIETTMDTHLSDLMGPWENISGYAMDPKDSIPPFSKLTCLKKSQDLNGEKENKRFSLMAGPIHLSELKAGQCRQSVEARLLRFWES
ncbi:Uncharacterized protein Rs2_35019 [Raphanus sativus]|nr:Uncharacterized protein Rs2_35019 [Raphanus sativus]